MKPGISTLIEFFARDASPAAPLAGDDEDRLRPGASMRPERLRGRRGWRARMRRRDVPRLASATA